MRRIALMVVAVVLGGVGQVGATVFVPGDYGLLASFRTEGLYNLDGLEYWNGQPLSPTNKPNLLQRRLAATLNFYSDPAEQNVLFAQVTSVITTHNATWSGTAFENVSQSGLAFTLPTPLATPLFSDQFANFGQVRRFGPPRGSVEPIFTTPGYGLNELLPGTYSIETVNGVDNAFTSLRIINNATRLSGGVFQLTFNPSVNLFDFDYGNTTASSIYGRQSQVIEGDLLFSHQPSPIPEATTAIVWSLIGLMAIGIRRRRFGN